MNLIPKIAEMLGVEIGERFAITSDVYKDGNYYYFSETELLEHVEDRTPDYAQYRVLADLIYGDKKVVKLPFEPKVGDIYHFVRCDNYDLFIDLTIWKNNALDFAMKYCGNVFRSETEAEKQKYAVYERLTGKKWGDGAK